MDKQINEQESLQIIQGMIQSVKYKIQDNGFNYLLWGWLVFIAAAAHYTLLKTGYEHHYLPWPILMSAGAVISLIYNSRAQKKKGVKTYIDEFMLYIVGAFVISLFLSLFFMVRIGPEGSYPIVMILYGFFTFSMGGILKFNPLLIGGVVCWVCAIASFYVPFDQQLIFLAISVLGGYIIPGHILKANYKHEQV